MDQSPEEKSEVIERKESGEFAQVQQFRNDIHAALSEVIVGQQTLIDNLLITLLARGHALLEGVPGVAKTLTAKTLATLLGIDFSRIQFTPDLMPADIVGTKIFDLSDSQFKIEKGPVFSNLLLIDEVNRAPAKTQSAMLEVMEERQVTIEGATFKLEEPFMVLATQNPIEFEGTYNLPEAQMDRFLMKIEVGYPTEAEETEILKRFHSGKLSMGKGERGEAGKTIVSGETLLQLRKIVEKVAVEEAIMHYINAIVRLTRTQGYLYMGSSPRGNISLLLAAKAKAALEGRDYVNPDDVKTMAIPVLRHRVMLSPEAEIEGLTADRILEELADKAEVPR